MPGNRMKNDIKISNDIEHMFALKIVEMLMHNDVTCDDLLDALASEIDKYEDETIDFTNSRTDNG